MTGYTYAYINDSLLDKVKNINILFEIKVYYWSK